MLALPLYATTASPAPAIASLNYELGDTAGGGQSIVITGTNLANVSSVSFGGTSATVTNTTSTTVTCTLPAKAAGTTTVSVTGPGGTSNTLSFEFWDPTVDSSVTVLFDSVHTAYDGTSWSPRYAGTSITLGQLPGAGANVAASNGGPNFDGDATSEWGLGSWTNMSDASTGAEWSDFLGAPVSGERAGSVAVVASSTTTSVLSMVSGSGGTPYGNPQFVGNMHNSAGTIGIGAGVDSGDSNHKWYAHVFDGGGYKTTAVQLASGASLHAAVSRWGTGTTSLDLSIDGATNGDPEYASIALAAGTPSGYAAYPITVGAEYDASGASTQTIAGNLRAFAILNAKASDTFITKHYAWSRQRFGVT